MTSTKFSMSPSYPRSGWVRDVGVATIREARKAALARAQANSEQADTAGQPLDPWPLDPWPLDPWPLDPWKASLKADVEKRFGPTPENLVRVGEAGW